MNTNDTIRLLFRVQTNIIPRKTCFTTTIYKGQGPKLKITRIDLRKGYFPNGQFYVVSLRVGKFRKWFAHIIAN